MRASGPGGPRGAALLIVGLALAVAWYLFGMTKSSILRREGVYSQGSAGILLPQHSERHHEVTPSEPLLEGTKTLSFLACNGFANQRLSLVYGLVLAHASGRAAILPNLVADGTQLVQEAGYVDKVAAGSNALAFDAVFDVRRLAGALAKHGVAAHTAGVSRPGPPPRNVTLRGENAAGAALAHVADATHVALDCPLWRVSAASLAPYEGFVLDVLGAMLPAPARERLVDRVVARVAAKGGAAAGGAFAALHLRYEEDWYRHCAVWTAIPDGRVRDNCGLLDADALVAKLRSFGLRRDVPLYVATQTAQLRSPDVLDALRREFTVVMKEDVLPAATLAALSREEAALVEYFVATRAAIFVGNSVSTFSALVIMERRAVGAVATWYNGGDVPLEGMMPFFRMPWIFTYNDFSSSYDEMMMVAVWTGITRGRLLPYCLFQGSADSAPYQWMARMGVHIIQRDPEWADDFARIAVEGRDGNAKHSHLYASREAIVGTWQRIDIPLLPELRPFDYMLFTDADVIFRRRVNAAEFGYPLPACLGMGTEMIDTPPYNAGVMLMRIGCLRDTYAEFMAFILSNKHGLFFPGYGPVDQGALNQFYEARITRIPKKWNAKPYHDELADAVIVHFHGPKPSHYVEFARSGECPLNFGTLCREGQSKAAPRYVAIYQEELSALKAAEEAWKADGGAAGGGGGRRLQQQQPAAAVDGGGDGGVGATARAAVRLRR